MSRSVLSVAVLLLGVTSATSQAQQDATVVVTPGTEVWGSAPPKLPAGAQIAVVFGDRTKPGELYVFRAKLPDG